VEPGRADLTKILNALRGIPFEAGLRAEFEGLSPGTIADFIREVDHSPHSLEDWIKAHDSFLTWLASRGRSVPWAKRQEYLLCCIEGMMDPAGNIPLEAKLHHYLEKNGLDD
jgi:hypothetical protein